MERRFKVKDRVRVSKESLPGHPETMRLGWILDVADDGGALRYEVGLSIPNIHGTTLWLGPSQIEPAAQDA